MANPRTEIDELRLQHSPNLGRALNREKAEAEPLSPGVEREVEQIDALIAAAMKACKKGSTVRGRRNPAFANLASLIKSRDLLLRGKKRPTAKSANKILAEANELLGAN